MATAAFVVSLVALVVSGISVAYTRVQGVETRRLRQIEAARRHDEQTPEITGEIEPVNDGSWYRLWLTLHSSKPLQQLEVRIVEGTGISFTPGQDGVQPMTARPLEAAFHRSEPLLQGERYAWGLEFDPKTAPAEMRLRATCHGTNEVAEPVAWDVLVTLKVPIDLGRTIH